MDELWKSDSLFNKNNDNKWMIRIHGYHGKGGGIAGQTISMLIFETKLKILLN